MFVCILLSEMDKKKPLTHKRHCARVLRKIQQKQNKTSITFFGNVMGPTEMPAAGRKVCFEQLRLSQSMCHQLDHRACFLSHTSTHIHVTQTEIIRVEEEIRRQRQSEEENKGTQDYLSKKERQIV